MRDDYFKEALEIVDDPYVLVSMITGRVKMLQRGNRPLVESLERLSFEDIALREIIEGRITYILGDVVVLEDIVTRKRAGKTSNNLSTSPLVDAPCSAVARM